MAGKKSYEQRCVFSMQVRCVMIASLLISLMYVDALAGCKAYQGGLDEGELANVVGVDCVNVNSRVGVRSCCARK